MFPPANALAGLGDNNMKLRHGLATATAAAALVFASAGFAQTDENRVETVIVTGKRLPAEEQVPLKTTFSEGRISDEQILNASPATTVQGLLSTQPSIYVQVAGPNGVLNSTKFRSFSDGEFGETFAGVPLNDIFNGGVEGEADINNNDLFLVSDLQSVQIYRGVNNPDVNTYNSLGGTINFTPRQPTDEMGGNVGVDGGSFGTLDEHVTFDTGDLYGIEQTVTIARDFSSGWVENTPDQRDHLYHAATADVGPVKLSEYFVYDHNEGDIPQGIPVDLIEANGWNWNFPESIQIRRDNDTKYLGVIGAEWRVNDFITVVDQAYGSDDNYHRVGFSNWQYNGDYYLWYEGSNSSHWKFLEPEFPLVGGVQGTQAYGKSLTNGKTYNYATSDYHSYGITEAQFGDRLQAIFDLPFNKISIGGDYNAGTNHSREYVYGSYYMPNIDETLTSNGNDWWDEHQIRQLGSAYIQDDIHLFDERLHITPGLKYDGMVSKDNDALGYFYDNPGSLHDDNHFLSPTVGANFAFTDNFSLYGSFGKNVKFPEISSLYEEIGGTSLPPPTVQPEYALDYEVGARYQSGGLHVDMDFYQENFSHVIEESTIPNDDDAEYFYNGGSERYQGVELSIDDDFGQWWIGDWKGYLHASYNNAVCTSTTTDYLTSGSCIAGEELNNVPKYLLSANLTWDYDGWHATLDGTLVGSQHLGNYSSGLPELPSCSSAAQAENGGCLAPGELSEMPSYFLLNVGIVKVIPISGLGPVSDVRVALHVDNLTNAHYYDDAEAHYTNYTNGDYTYGYQAAPRAVYASVSVYF